MGMVADMLSELFSDVRLKVLRLFLQHPDGSFGFKEMRERLLADRTLLRAEVRLLSRIGFLELVKDSKPRKSPKSAPQKWRLNSAFELLRPLRALVLKKIPVSRAELTKRFAVLGS